MTALGTLLHDTNHDLGSIRNEAIYIRTSRVANRMGETETLERLVRIEKHVKDCLDKLDEFYKNHNNKFK